MDFWTDKICYHLIPASVLIEIERLRETETVMGQSWRYSLSVKNECQLKLVVTRQNALRSKTYCVQKCADLKQI